MAFEQEKSTDLTREAMFLGLLCTERERKNERRKIDPTARAVKHRYHDEEESLVSYR